MAHPNYEGKVLPFIKAHPVVNKLVTVPFFGTGFELKELAKNLRRDEEILYITACKLAGSGTRVLVCVTNLRFYVLDKGLIVKRYQMSVDLPTIASVTRGRGLVFGSVIISITGYEDDLNLTGFWLKDTENFEFALQEALTNYRLGRVYSSGNPLQGSQGYPQGGIYPQTPPQSGYGYSQGLNGGATVQGSQSSFGGGAYQNPTYNHLTGEPFTEAELREMGYQEPRPHRVQPRPVVQNPQQGYSRVNRNQQGYQQPVVSQSDTRSYEERLASISYNQSRPVSYVQGELRETRTYEQQVADSLRGIEDLYRRGQISEELYRMKKEKLEQGRLY